MLVGTYDIHGFDKCLGRVLATTTSPNRLHGLLLLELRRRVSLKCPTGGWNKPSFKVVVIRDNALGISEYFIKDYSTAAGDFSGKESIADYRVECAKIDSADKHEGAICSIIADVRSFSQEDGEIDPSTSRYLATGLSAVMTDWAVERRGKAKPCPIPRALVANLVDRNNPQILMGFREPSKRV